MYTYMMDRLFSVLPWWPDRRVYKWSAEPHILNSCRARMWWESVKASMRLLLCNVIRFGTGGKKERKQKCLMCQVKTRSGKVFEDGVKKSFEDMVCVIGFVWNSQMRMKRSRVTGSRAEVRCRRKTDIFTAVHCPLLDISTEHRAVKRRRTLERI